MNDQDQKYKYLKLLAEKYPTRQSVYAELIHLNGVLSLPKPTEHFMRVICMVNMNLFFTFLIIAQE
ncbi:fructose-bisphosphatase class III [Pectinatus frisingensis]|uniref:fructose-bisphosphatase class III n=1 Tax=Pectinatus frisingensis TaxID=865 RepID=UPI0022AA34DA|nr:fructose-bisphosphatase class III [Pectinatus frisingensis]